MIKKLLPLILFSLSSPQISAFSSMDIFADMDETFKKMESEIGRLRTQFMEKYVEPSIQIKEYGTEEGDTSPYRLEIILPGFKQEDIKVTISSCEKNNQTSQHLELTGTKKVTKATEKETEKNGKKVTMKTASSQAFISEKYINGRKNSIQCTDGNLKIKLDLPLDIDINEGEYTMKFDAKKETLTLEFPKKSEPETNKMALEFTDKK